jgi:hypothetical protein
MTEEAPEESAQWLLAFFEKPHSGSESIRKSEVLPEAQRKQSGGCSLSHDCEDSGPFELLKNAMTMRRDLDKK